MVCRAITAIVLIFGVVGPALALCEGEPVAKDHFSHEHKVYHFNGDDPSVATDELRLWKASDGTQCFSLMTIGPNHHECDISGPAAAGINGALEFEDKTCKLIFIRSADGVILKVSPGWERLGVCPRQFHCGMYGVVESGTYK